MILIISLSIGIMAGFNSEWYSIKYNTDKFYEETNYKDYTLINENGFSINDKLKIENIDGVDSLSRFLSFDINIDSLNKNIKLCILDEYNVSTFKLIKGSDYDNTLFSIWINENFAVNNRIAINEKLKISFNDYTYSFIVKGYIKSSEFLINLKDNEIMPDFRNYGYAYTNIETLNYIVKENIKNEDPSISIEDLDSLTVSTIDKYFTEIHIKANKIIDDFDDNYIVIDKNNDPYYNKVLSEIKIGKIVSIYLPLIFLIVGVLTLSTTIIRIVKNERKQIGLLKSLGYSNNLISILYTSYSFIVGIIGSTIGLIIGFIIPKFIVSENGTLGTYFEMPYWENKMPWFVYLIIILVIFIIAIIGFIFSYKQINDNITNLFNYDDNLSNKSVFKRNNKLPLSLIYTLRKILRHYKKSIVIILSMASVIMILFTGLGLYSSYKKFINSYSNTYSYNSIICFDDSMPNTAIDLKNKYGGTLKSSNYVSYNNSLITLDIYSDNNVQLLNDNYQLINIEDNGVYVSKRIYDSLDNKESITIKNYKDNKEYNLKINGYFLSLDKIIISSSDYMDYKNFEYSYNKLLSNTSLSSIENQNEIKNIIKNEYISESIENLLKIFRILIMILIVFSISLFIIVLYNLCDTSLKENEVDNNILMILGFDNKFIIKLFLIESLILSIISIFLGLILGNISLKFIINLLSDEYEFVAYQSFYIYLIVILSTIIVNVFISFLTYLKMKKRNILYR